MSKVSNIDTEVPLEAPLSRSEIENLVLKVVGQDRQPSLTEQDIKSAKEFHREVREVFGYEEPESSESGTLVVTHMRHARPETFLFPMQEVMHVFGVVPKPNSIDEKTVERARRGEELGEQEDPILMRPYKVLEVLNWTRDDVHTSAEVIQYLEKIREELGWDWDKRRGFVINDNGGYFASSLATVKDIMGDYFYGVVEDTNNGIDKYQKLDALPCPVISVARSPLKAGENYLVGQDIEYATQQILEPIGKYTPEAHVVAIGYGPIGRSIAQAVERRGMKVTINDIDERKLSEASTDYSVISDLSAILSEADVIYSATGNKGLRKEHFPLIKNGAEIALATSGDDELDEEGLRDLYDLTPVDGDEHRVLCKSKTGDHYFYLTNGLKTINFTVPSGIGTAMFPLQAEIIRATQQLNAKEGKFPHKIIEISDEDRFVIGLVFAKYFGRSSMTVEEMREIEKRLEKYASKYKKDLV